MNIVDILIIAFLIYSIYDGWKRGLLALVADLIALFLSILLALKFYPPLAPLTVSLLRIPEQAAQVISFFVLAFVLGSLFSLVFGIIIKLIPPLIRGSVPDRAAGSLLGIAKGVVYVGIVLLLISALPVLQPVKDAVATSRLSPPITQRVKVIAAQAEGYLKSNFEGLVEDTFSLLTIKPGEAGIDLGFKTTKVSVDHEAENEMLRLLNDERRKEGLVPLVMDEEIREVARAHSRDMFTRGYFAHDTPEGITPAQRLDKMGIKYTIMGENLALAPDVALAHRGLMNSPSHRENILFPDYRKVGIGAVNGGIYGIMFSQEFTD